MNTEEIKWISVNYAMPPIGSEVVVTDGEYTALGKLIGYICESDTAPKPHFIYACFDKQKPEEICYWMHLPDKPIFIT